MKPKCYMFCVDDIQTFIRPEYAVQFCAEYRVRQEELIPLYTETDVLAEFVERQEGANAQT